MNKIDAQCQKIKKEGRVGLMAHVVVGYPTIEDTRALANMMAQEGVDFIELQIPFSDPLGDGPIIHQANSAALAKGLRVRDAFELLRALRAEDQIEIPLLFMTYLNIPFTYGLEKFCADAEEAGTNGLIIPDYNLEHESVDHLHALAQKHNQELIRFISLDSDAERMEKLGSGAEGFVYCFAARGITGVRQELDSYLTEHLAHVRKFVSQPLAVGFGISSGEHIRALKNRADIAVVGSAMIKAFEAGGLEAARTKIRELVAAAKDQ